MKRSCSVSQTPMKYLKFGGVFQETLEEYFITYECFIGKIERLDQRIEELASMGVTRKNKRLGCLLGVKTHTVINDSGSR